MRRSPYTLQPKVVEENNVKKLREEEGRSAFGPQGGAAVHHCRPPITLTERAGALEPLGDNLNKKHMSTCCGDVGWRIEICGRFW